MSKVIEIKEFRALISPHNNQGKPIYNWHTFKHSYSKELVNSLVPKLGLKKGDWVLDPFCGGGTTLLACKELGINTNGFDILPFSVFLTNVKIRNYNPELLKKEKEKLFSGEITTKKFPSLSNIPIAQKAFSPAVKNELIRIKSRIEGIKNKNVREFFNLGLLSILESVSNTSKSGGFLRIVKRKINSKSIEKAFLDRVDSMISDVIAFNQTFQFEKVISIAKKSDARRLNTKRKYHAIITSPPYPNRHDYTRIYSLEMLLDFVSSNDDLKKIRYETLRSHVEARKKYGKKSYIQPKSLTQLIEQVKQNGVNNPQVIGMLEGYFEDMFLALMEMKRSLIKTGKIALVVSNVRFSGINIPVDKILSEIGKQAGLNPKAIWLARYRGNSSQQMKEYKRNPSRESIVVWEN